MIEALGSQIVGEWPEESQEPARAVLEKYGEPDEATESFLIWHDAGPWKRIVVTKQLFPHEFPAPHKDSVESFVDYRVAPDLYSALAEFDGSVMAERTTGELSARCHDEEANNLALNLVHDIVTGTKTMAEAREYYAKEFLDFRRKKPTPYMETLRFEPLADAADPDERILADEDLEAAEREGSESAA
ncbi:MAG: hypothetical protein LC722_04895 [Actinobacteria bacterium]|nr:hypothetical protein [Actinomycetota bacterium]